MDDDISVKRFRAGLISNIRDAIHILDENNIHTDVIDRIKENLKNYVDKCILMKKLL
jgi:predicted neutral ceramidase superfamily lipid hydrolase